MQVFYVILQNLNYKQIIVVIMILGTVTYGRNALSDSLFNDEWAIINRIVFTGTVACPRTDPNIFLRPLASCWSSLLFHAFGVNVVAYHMATLFVVILRSVVLFFLLDRLFPKWRLLSFACTLLFLVYPTSFYHLIFESGYHPVAHILFFFTCLLLLIFFQQKQWWAYLLAAGLLILSLLIYEAHMGLMILASLAFFIASKHQPVYQRLAYLVPALIVILFGIGRWWTQLQIGSYFGHSVDSVTLAPTELFQRFLIGYATSLSAGMFNALNNILRRQVYSHVTLTLGIGAVVFVVLVLLALLLIKKHVASEDGEQTNGMPETLRDQFTIIAIGLFVIGAGYVPVILAVNPSLAFLHSRVNVLPGIGAVLVLTAVFTMLPKLLGWKGQKAVFAFLALVIPFILLGSATQRASQIEGETAWAQHKKMWQQMFALVPDMTPDSQVLLKMPSERPIGTWPFTNALAVLYGHNDIAGQIVVEGYDSLSLVDDNIQGDFAYPVPCGHAILLVYDAEKDELVYAKVGENIYPLTADDIQCPDCVVEAPVKTAEWRVLVQD